MNHPDIVIITIVIVIHHHHDHHHHHHHHRRHCRHHHHHHHRLAIVIMIIHKEKQTWCHMTSYLTYKARLKAKQQTRKLVSNSKNVRQQFKCTVQWGGASSCKTSGLWRTVGPRFRESEVFDARSSGCDSHGSCSTNSPPGLGTAGAGAPELPLVRLPLLDSKASGIGSWDCGGSGAGAAKAPSSCCPAWAGSDAGKPLPHFNLRPVRWNTPRAFALGLHLALALLFGRSLVLARAVLASIGDKGSDKSDRCPRKGQPHYPYLISTKKVKQSMIDTWETWEAQVKSKAK